MDAKQKMASGGGLKNSLVSNNMNYVLPESLTNTVSSTMTKQQFQKRTYRQNETARCILNTGNDFVDWDKSYLFLRVKMIAPTALSAADVKAGFGVGSAMNLFSEIKIASRQGAEICRTPKANFINNLRAKWMHTQEYLDSVGSAAGFSTAAVYPVNASTETAFAIPVTMLGNFFKPAKGVDAMPQLCSGLDIEFLTAPVGQVFHEDSSGELGEISDYEITDMYFNVVTKTKQDSIVRSVAQSSASSGLAYRFDKTFSTNTLGASGTTSLEINVQKACSFANRCTTAGYLEANQSLITEDSFVTVAYPYTSVQTRVGSVYLPLQPLASGLNAGYGKLLSYLYTQNAYGNKGNSVTLTKYTDGTSGSSCIAASLEKSSDLAMSGLSLNNSRSLNISLSFASLAANVTFLTFVDFVGISNVYLNNISTKE